MRPIKKPASKVFEKWSVIQLISEEIRFVLNKTGKVWREQDINLIAHWMAHPDTINVDKVLTIPNKKIPKKIQAYVKQEKTLAATMFARMFAESPNELIDALPKIKKRVAKLFKTNAKAIVFHEAIKQDLARVMNRDADRILWNTPKPAIEFSKSMARDITQKDIEHARAEIVKRFPRK